MGTRRFVLKSTCFLCGRFSNGKPKLIARVALYRTQLFLIEVARNFFGFQTRHHAPSRWRVQRTYGPVPAQGFAWPMTK